MENTPAPRALVRHSGNVSVLEFSMVPSLSHPLVDDELLFGWELGSTHGPPARTEGAGVRNFLLFRWGL
eukprot:3258271-Pyramimonas_sp.AAC.1